jgi:pyruvate kinase
MFPAPSSISPLTVKDREDLEFGLAHGVDWVALSFVQRRRISRKRARSHRHAGVDRVAKLEKPAAIGRRMPSSRSSTASWLPRRPGR